MVGLSAILGSFLIKNPNQSTSLAGGSSEPRQIKITNYDSDGFTVSWFTDIPTASFVRLDNSEPNLFLDDRDQGQSTTRSLTHSVTLRGLKASSEYFFKIGSGNQLYDDHGQSFLAKTTKAGSNQTQADPAYGQVVTASGDPATGAIVYATLQGGTSLSSLVGENGTWLIPLNRSWTTDFSSPLAYPNRGARLSLLVEAGPAGRSGGEVLTGLDQPVPLITLGQDFTYTDLTQAPPEELLPLATPAPAPVAPKAVGPDLNDDGFVNTLDLGVLRQAIDQGSQDLRFDLNGDGKIDEGDIETLLKQWG